MKTKRLAVACLALGLTGCATGGPYHGYSTLAKKDLASSDHDIRIAIESGNLERLGEALKHAQQVANPNSWMGKRPSLESLVEWERGYQTFSENLYRRLVVDDSPVSKDLGRFDRVCLDMAGLVCADEVRENVQYHAAMANMEEQAELARRVEDIRYGEASVSSLDEARAFYSSKDGARLLTNPRVGGGDNEYYEVVAYITESWGDGFLSWWPDAIPGYPEMGSIVSNPQYFVEAKYREPVIVIGKYVDNVSLTTVLGKRVTLPRFDEAMVFEYSQ